MENTEDYFSLKWSDFRSSLTEGFHDFLQEETMVDVTLAAEGKIVQAHKLVLSVCSPYFKNIFKVNPCKHPVVILKDVGHNDLSYMLEFMYKGEVGVKQEDLPSFLKLADTLKVRGLAGEKLQKSEESSLKTLESNIARVRKKIKTEISVVNKENSELESLNKDQNKKVTKSRKRRILCKSEPVKKLKSNKCRDTSVNKCENTNSDNVSEDEENNLLIKCSVKNGEGSKNNNLQCENENECDSKTNFSAWSDGVPDSDDSGGPDINSFFQSNYSEETEQTPQGQLTSVIFSRTPRAFVWDYFLKETHKAICMNCGKTFKGQRPNTICEQHLRRRHPEFYKVLLEKKIKRAELHMGWRI